MRETYKAVTDKIKEAMTLEELVLLKMKNDSLEEFLNNFDNHQKEDTLTMKKKLIINLKKRYIRTFSNYEHLRYLKSNCDFDKYLYFKKIHNKSRVLSSTIGQEPWRSATKNINELEHYKICFD